MEPPVINDEEEPEIAAPPPSPVIGAANSPPDSNNFDIHAKAVACHAFPVLMYYKLHKYNGVEPIGNVRSFMRTNYPNWLDGYDRLMVKRFPGIHMPSIQFGSGCEKLDRLANLALATEFITYLEGLAKMEKKLLPKVLRDKISVELYVNNWEVNDLMFCYYELYALTLNK